MDTERFLESLLVVRQENSILLLAYHLKEIGYEDLYIKVYNEMYPIKEGDRYEYLKEVANWLLESFPKSNDREIQDLLDLAKNMFMADSEFEEVTNSYTSKYYKRLCDENKKVFQKANIYKIHRVCRVASIFDAKRYLDTGIYPRGLGYGN